MPIYDISDLDVDVFDFAHHVAIIYRDNKVVTLTAEQAWDFGHKMMTMARLVDKHLPKEVIFS